MQIAKQRMKEMCRMCGKEDGQAISSGLTTKYGDRFQLMKCTGCGYVYTNPLPSDQLLQRYYDENYWQSGKLKDSRALNTFYKIRMSGIVGFIRKTVASDAKILDWGCGDGSLVKLLRSAGYNCYGLDAYTAEPDVPHIINATIDESGFAAGSFDVITCFHVLEHLTDPVDAFEKAFRLLKPGGLIIVEVPNFNSLGSRLFKSNWQPLQIPTHISHFTPETLATLCKRVGCSHIIKTEFFSHRISPSAWVLSLVPFLTPKRVRQRCGGRYPLAVGAVYFVLQILAYPVAIGGALIRHGEIVRIYARKSGR